MIQLGSIAEPAVIPYLKHEDGMMKKRAAEILAKLGTASSLPALKANLKDPSIFARKGDEEAIKEINARIEEKKKK